MSGTAEFEQLMRRAFLIGLGATALTMEKVEEFSKELVEKGKLTEQEAKTFGDDLKSKARKEAEAFETKLKDRVDECVKSTMDRLGLVTKADLEALKDSLKKELKAEKAAKK